MKIWKFPIENAADVHIEGCKRVLSVGLQDGKPNIWAEVDPEDKWNVVVAEIVMTGGTPPPSGRFVGTIIGIGGWAVAHVYAHGEMLQ